MTQVPEKQRAQAKTAPLRFHRHVGTTSTLPKPAWIRAKIGSSPRYNQIKNLLREQNLHTVCEEARCPNIGECFSSGTATFMILGDVCTRRCPFCDVAHGRPLPVDAEEPQRLAQAVGRMGLDYVVLTSVDRDDLRDGGAGHFARCVKALREHRPGIRIETLVPDFRGRLDVALQEFSQALPDVFNHNMETVPRLYPTARPGADYAHSLNLLSRVKKLYPELPTKSGLMVGLGEDDDELLETLQDLRQHGVDRLTVGQYLAPSAHHHPVMRYLSPDAFEALTAKAHEMGFVHATCGPLVRSSYHARHEDALAASQ